jgi:hypothetical protein
LDVRKRRRNVEERKMKKENRWMVRVLEEK